MTAGSERVVAVIIGILVLVVIALSITLVNTRDQIGESEKILNKIHRSKIGVYDRQIYDYQNLITKLRSENDSLLNLKQKIKTVTVREVDSVRALPFDGRAEFWTEEAARLDSIRIGYTGGNNSGGL